MTTFAGQVSQSSDDAGQVFSTGAVSTTGTVAALQAFTNRTQWLAFRFQNVTIPAGATITAATLSLWSAGTNLGMNAKIFGNLTANPSTLSTTTNYISGLAETTNSVLWNATLTGSQFNDSPDISAIITELIGQGGWASGNAMLFILQAQSSGSRADIELYDGNSVEGAQLSITYTAPGGGTRSNLLLMGIG